MKTCSYYIGAILFCLMALNAKAQMPIGYYNSTKDLCGDELRQKLSTIVSTHTAISYSDLWGAFAQTDKRSNGKIWDIYSACDFEYRDDQCGNYSAECHCYNREHSFPESWFNEGTPMRTDLFHVYPTDGWVNNKRGNLPYGEVNSASYTSGNGSKIGTCVYPGYSGTVFEPIDEYKGDIARSYFYMMTAYKSRISTWNSDMLSGGNLAEWAKNMLLEWHHNDPVSQKEIDRNEAIYAIQHNRNPFIDCPYFADAIWGDHCDFEFCLDFSNIVEYEVELSIFPNPASDNIAISSNSEISNIAIINILGEKVLDETINCDSHSIDISKFPRGTYFLQAKFNNGSSKTQKIIIL